MNRIETKVMTGLVAVAIGFAPLVYPAAANSSGKAVSSKAKSPDSDAPVIARIAVRPSAEQLAKLRAERRLAALANRPGMGPQAAGGQGAAKSAL